MHSLSKRKSKTLHFYYNISLLYFDDDYVMLCLVDSFSVFFFIHWFRDDFHQYKFYNTMLLFFTFSIDTTEPVTSTYHSNILTLV